jgi:hypothetical protein
LHFRKQLRTCQKQQKTNIYNIKNEKQRLIDFVTIGCSVDQTNTNSLSLLQLSVRGGSERNKRTKWIRVDGSVQLADEWVTGKTKGTNKDAS